MTQVVQIALLMHPPELIICSSHAHHMLITIAHQLLFARLTLKALGADSMGLCSLLRTMMWPWTYPLDLLGTPWPLQEPSEL